MVDYYAILSRAVDTAEASDRGWRVEIFMIALGTH